VRAPCDIYRTLVERQFPLSQRQQGESSDNVVDGRTIVELAYQPQSADTLVGLRVRERIKWAELLLRGALLFLTVGSWLVFSAVRGNVDVFSTAVLLLVVLLLWGYPRLQAAQVQRLVGWQGEYRASVSPARDNMPYRPQRTDPEVVRFPGVPGNGRSLRPAQPGSQHHVRRRPAQAGPA
jgi:hypothetical protein